MCRTPFFAERGSLPGNKRDLEVKDLVRYTWYCHFGIS